MCLKGHVDEVAAAEAEGGATVADRLHKNVKVWSLYLDLEESLGTVDSCRTAYDRAIDLKVRNRQIFFITFCLAAAAAVAVAAVYCL